MAIHKVDGVDGVNNFPKKFVTLHALAAITKGEIVAIETDTTVTDYAKNGLGASVIKSTGTSGDEGLVLGVAAETITAAGDLKIQTAGKFVDAIVVDGVTRGEILVPSSVTAGALAPIEVAFDDTFNRDDLKFARVAVALESEGTGGTESGTALKADIMIIDQGYF